MSRKTIRWLEAARDDLAHIAQRIADDNPRAAEQFTERIFSLVEYLERLPYLGAASPFHRKARYLVHGSYVIYYTVHRREVVIRAVVHGAQTFRSAWLRRD